MSMVRMSIERQVAVIRVPVNWVHIIRVRVIRAGAARAFTETLNYPHSLCITHFFAVLAILSRLVNLYGRTEIKTNRN